MIDTLLSYIAPHHCCGCGKIGSLLCDNCKYNISDDRFDSCILCGGSATPLGLCGRCKPPFERGWCVGERTEELKLIIDGYKFERKRAASQVLGRLLSDRIGMLPQSTVIVPVPTIAAHIRVRGYDHTLLLARVVAVHQSLSVSNVLERKTTTKQRGASRHERFLQAKVAYGVKHPLDPELPYLLIDDVVTTGATIHYAAQALRDAGARHVWVGVIARQPLD